MPVALNPLTRYFLRSEENSSTRANLPLPEEYRGAPVELDLSALGLGEALLVSSDRTCPDVFIARVKSPQPGPSGGVPAGAPDEYFVAYSRVCTHMGGYLLSPVDGEQTADGYRRPLVEGDPEAHTVHCPCHFTAYDLIADGRVVVGQATCRLPQLQLEPAGDKKVRVKGWLQDSRAPRSMPYGAADEMP